MTEFYDYGGFRFEERRERALALRARGMTYREIAYYMGIGKSTANRYCNEAVLERDRRRARKNESVS